MKRMLLILAITAILVNVVSSATVYDLFSQYTELSPVIPSNERIYSLCYNSTSKRTQYSSVSIQYPRVRDVVNALDALTDCDTAADVTTMDWSILSYVIDESTTLPFLESSAAPFVLAIEGVWDAVEAQAMVWAADKRAERAAKITSAITNDAQTDSAEAYEEELIAMRQREGSVFPLPAQSLIELGFGQSDLHYSTLYHTADDAVFDLSTELAALVTAAQALEDAVYSVSDPTGLASFLTPVSTAASALVTAYASSMTTAASLPFTGDEDTDPRPFDELIFMAAHQTQAALHQASGMVLLGDMQQCSFAGVTTGSASCDTISTASQTMNSAITSFLTVVRDGIDGLPAVTDQKYSSVLPALRYWADAALSRAAPTDLTAAPPLPSLRGGLLSDLHGLFHEYTSEGPMIWPDASTHGVMYYNSFGMSDDDRYLKSAAYSAKFWGPTKDKIVTDYTWITDPADRTDDRVNGATTPVTPRTFTGADPLLSDLVDRFPLNTPTTRLGSATLPALPGFAELDPAETCTAGSSCRAGYWCDAGSLVPETAGYYSPAGSCIQTACTIPTNAVAISPGRGIDACRTMCASEDVYRATDGSCDPVPAGYYSPYGSERLVLIRKLSTTTTIENSMLDALVSGLTAGVCTSNGTNYNTTNLGDYCFVMPGDSEVDVAIDGDCYTVSYPPTYFNDMTFQQNPLTSVADYWPARLVMPWEGMLRAPLTLKVDIAGFFATATSFDFTLHIANMVEVTYSRNSASGSVDIGPTDESFTKTKYTVTFSDDGETRTYFIILVDSTGVTVYFQDADTATFKYSPAGWGDYFYACQAEYLSVRRYQHSIYDVIGFSGTLPSMPIVGVEVHNGFVPDATLMWTDATLPAGAGQSYDAGDISTPSILAPTYSMATLPSKGEYGQITASRAEITVVTTTATSFSLVISRNGTDTITPDSIDGVDLTTFEERSGTISTVYNLPAEMWDGVTVESDAPVYVTIRTTAADQSDPLVVIKGTMLNATYAVDLTSDIYDVTTLPSHTSLTMVSCGVPDVQEIRGGFGQYSCYLTDDSGSLIVNIVDVQCNLTLSDGSTAVLDGNGTIFSYDPSVSRPILSCNTDDYLYCLDGLDDCSNSTDAGMYVGPDLIDQSNYLQCYYINTTVTENNVTFCVTPDFTLPSIYTDVSVTSAAVAVSVQFSVATYGWVDSSAVYVTMFPDEVGTLPAVPDAWKTVADASGATTVASILHNTVTYGLTSPVARSSPTVSKEVLLAIRPVTLGTECLADAVLPCEEATVYVPRLTDPTTLPAIPLEDEIEAAFSPGASIIVDLENLFEYSGNKVGSNIQGVASLSACDSILEWQYRIKSATSATAPSFITIAPTDNCQLAVPAPSTVGSYTLSLRFRVGPHGFRVLGSWPTETLLATERVWKDVFTTSAWTNAVGYSFTVRDRLSTELTVVAKQTNTTVSAAFDRAGADAFITYSGECVDVSRVDRYSAAATVDGTPTRPYLFNSTTVSFTRDSEPKQYCIHAVSADSAPSPGVAVLVAAVGHSDVIGYEVIVVGIALNIICLIALFLCCATTVVSWLAARRRAVPPTFFDPDLHVCAICGGLNDKARSIDEMLTAYTSMHQPDQSVPEDALGKPICSRCLVQDYARMNRYILPETDQEIAQTPMFVAKNEHGDMVADDERKSSGGFLASVGSASIRGVSSVKMIMTQRQLGGSTPIIPQFN
ncbi:hypothetical protein J8273_1123 [Carpediemonas membranifera]|uniref:Uncharacterized protein n=1 Tax=Carpediemonas membranifera TaxID=201153 RepID=A0A8J6BBD3_9EUKA|nr:hypothetical protein J8273_1123 [Carpediemonas membranifera]|eukprot:KAG9397214.1 hypothetical protein J8273_1123 [Carpediemonas membranifera]